MPRIRPMHLALALMFLALAAAACGGGSTNLPKPCEGQDCSGHGTCQATDGQATCGCDTGYAGAICDACAAGYTDDGSGTCVMDAQCGADSCSGHGACDDSGGQVSCTCDSGYAGANCGSCAAGYTDDGTGQCVAQGNPHPQGWSASDQHGAAAKTGEMDCRSCHGSDLTGSGDADSCDSCHAAGWRTNCVFCHGGQDNQTGAPPVDLVGGSDSSTPTVGAHTTHVTGENHMVYDCNQCHVKPTDVLSPGHMFDDTPGRAEVDLRGGLSDAGAYDGQGCSSLYCHGNGRTANGSVAAYTGSIDDCTSCHATPPTTGRHTLHKNRGYTCQACHAGVASNATTITGPALHVNGQKDVELSSGGTWNANTNSCNPSCHGSKSW